MIRLYILKNVKKVKKTVIHDNKLYEIKANAVIIKDLDNLTNVVEFDYPHTLTSIDNVDGVVKVYANEKEFVISDYA